MNIGFDARMILSARRGIGRATYLLLKKLLEIDQDNKYYLFLDQKDTRAEIPLAPNASQIILPYKNYVLWEQVFLPICLRRRRLDIMHFPVGTAPVFFNHKFILTIHDLTRLLPRERLPGYSPYLYERLSRLYIRWLTPIITKKAHTIIVDSNHTGKDVQEILKIVAKKINVIYVAPAPEFRQVENQSEIKKTLEDLRIPKDYIFSVGSELGFKNTSGLIHAFQNLLRRDERSNLTLVISGVGRSKYFRELVKRLGIHDKVRLLEYIADRDLINLYNGALLFVFPSLYEGFGFPPLEAMACGTPVISSNRASLPEVIGDAAYLIDPEDPVIIADALEYLLNNPDKRQELSKKGLLKVKEYSWENTALQVLEVYQKGAGLV